MGFVLVCLTIPTTMNIEYHIKSCTVKSIETTCQSAVLQLWCLLVLVTTLVWKPSKAEARLWWQGIGFDGKIFTRHIQKHPETMRFPLFFWPMTCRGIRWYSYLTSYGIRTDTTLFGDEDDWILRIKEKWSKPKPWWLWRYPKAWWVLWGTHKSMSQLQAVPATAASSEVAPVTRFLFFYSSARNGGETHRDPPEPCGGWGWVGWEAPARYLRTLRLDPQRKKHKTHESDRKSIFMGLNRGSKKIGWPSCSFSWRPESCQDLFWGLMSSKDQVLDGPCCNEKGMMNVFLRPWQVGGSAFGYVCLTCIRIALGRYMNKVDISREWIFVQYIYIYTHAHYNDHQDLPWMIWKQPWKIGSPGYWWINVPYLQFIYSSFLGATFAFVTYSFCSNFFVVPIAWKTYFFRSTLPGWWFGCHFWHFPIYWVAVIIPIDELHHFSGRGGYTGPPTSLDETDISPGRSTSTLHAPSPHGCPEVLGGEWRTSEATASTSRSATGATSPATSPIFFVQLFFCSGFHHRKWMKVDEHG